LGNEFMIMVNQNILILRPKFNIFWAIFIRLFLTFNTSANKPILMASIYSELHQNIQDKCNEAEIEILSPHYSAVRDGNQTTIPENYLPQDYKSPGFRLSSLNNLFNPDNSKNTPDS